MTNNASSSGIIQTFSTNLGIQGCNLITGLLAARLLQPTGRGELATIMLWPYIIFDIGILGTYWAITRETARRRDKVDDLAKTGLIFGLLQAAIFLFIGYNLIPFFLPADKAHLIGLTQLFLLILPLKFVAFNLIAIDQGCLRWKPYNLVRLFEVLPYLICLLIFWKFSIHELSWFVMAILFGALIAVSLRVLMQWRSIRRGRFTWEDSISLFRSGLPFLLASLSGVITTHADRALVVGLLPADAVGWYIAALTFASVHSSLGGALGVTSFAALANETDPIRQGIYLTGVFRQASLLYLILSISMALLCPFLIVPLFGTSFAPARIPCSILVFSTTFIALAQILNEGLRGLGNVYQGISSQLLYGLVMATAAFILIPSLGVMGMAIAATLGALTQLIVMIVFSTRLFRLPLSCLWGLRVSDMTILRNRLVNFLPIKNT
jgi:O-antigen/teichoic acid export membrane protein